MADELSPSESAGQTREHASDYSLAYLRDARWRVGRSLGRTVYAMTGDEASKEDVLVGLMETPDLARMVVDGHNAATCRVPVTAARAEAAEIRRYVMFEQSWGIGGRRCEFGDGARGGPGEPSWPAWRKVLELHREVMCEKHEGCGGLGLCVAGCEEDGQPALWPCPTFRAVPEWARQRYGQEREKP